jgi:hypothetical protein
MNAPKAMKPSAASAAESFLVCMKDSCKKVVQDLRQMPRAPVP